MRSRASGGTCGDSLAAVSPRRGPACAGAHLDHPRQVDLAQLDRRPRERAHDRRRVLWIDEQAHPGEHVAHLGSLQERRPAALLARRARRATRARSGAGTTQGYGVPAERRPARPSGSALAGLRSWCGRDRLGRGPADRRADRRLAALRGRARRLGRAARARLRPPGERLQRPEPPAELPALEAVDRPAWIAANLSTMRPLLAPLTERIGDGSGPLAGPLRSASGFLLGAQVGALTGMLSQRVLGQYDLALLDASVPPRLLLLAPNLAQAARNLGVDRDELVLWVTIHEITHAVQFSGAPWLRDHLGGMLSELIDGLQVTIAAAPRRRGRGRRRSERGPGAAGRAPELPDPAELRELIARARRGELLRLTLGEDRWQLVERMQAAMSLIEGHAEHTMDAIGAEVLPSLPRLRAAMNHRRREPRPALARARAPARLELKLRQYEVGRRFCDAVVERGRPAGARARLERSGGAAEHGRAAGARRLACAHDASTPTPTHGRMFLLLHVHPFVFAQVLVCGYRPSSRIRCDDLVEAGLRTDVRANGNAERFKSEPVTRPLEARKKRRPTPNAHRRQVRRVRTRSTRQHPQEPPQKPQTVTLAHTKPKRRAAKALARVRPTRLVHPSARARTTTRDTARVFRRLRRARGPDSRRRRPDHP